MIPLKLVELHTQFAAMHLLSCVPAVFAVVHGALYSRRVLEISRSCAFLLCPTLSELSGGVI